MLLFNYKLFINALRFEIIMLYFSSRQNQFTLSHHLMVIVNYVMFVKPPFLIFTGPVNIADLPFVKTVFKMIFKIQVAVRADS